MANVRPLNNKKYHISKHRFAELYHFCLQYNEWKLELRYRTDTVGSAGCTAGRTGWEDQNPTETLAIERVTLEEKCRLIENTAREAEPEIYPYLLKAVTNEDITFVYLKEMMGIPCGKDMYYDRRRRFYYLLAQKKISL